MMKKNLISYLLALATLGACTSPPTTSTNNNNNVGETMSIEAQARLKTEEMRKMLSLNTTQSDEVLVTNTTYLKVIKKLKDENQSDKIPAANLSYEEKLKQILTPAQYTLFVESRSSN